MGSDPSNVAALESHVRDADEVAAGEPGTSMYDWYRTADGTGFIARAVFAESAAVLAHAAGVGGHLEQRIAASESFTVEPFGDPSQELHDVIAALGPTLLPPALG